MKLNQWAALQEKIEPPGQRPAARVFEVTPQSSNRVGQSATPGRFLSGDTTRAFSFKVAPNLLVSFKYAWAGVSYAFRTQRNFRIHLMIGALALSLGTVLHLSSMKMAVITLMISVVLAMELLNTAVEAIIDLMVQRTYHDLAKIAKDCAAGAVFIVSLAALLVASFLLLPPLADYAQHEWVLFRTIIF